GLVPLDLSVDRFAVRIEQQLGRIASLSVVRIPRSVHAIAVAPARADVREVSVKDEGGDLGKVDAGLHAVGVEETELHARRDFGEEREVRADAVPGRTEGVRFAGPHFHDGLVGKRSASCGHAVTRLRGYAEPLPRDCVT